ncbi:MAG TPA: DUF1905 domain-containing protein [Candidatus Paceibacterota bacterium]|nr:DUF1905 domain-containing protein [Candidatus Paceibacterota bacterium]
MGKKFTVRSEVIVWPGAQGAWHLAHIDKKESEEIRKHYKGPRRGFGAVRVRAKVGKTVWETSIFPDSRSGTYILPLKLAVRQAEGLFQGDKFTFTVEF